MAAPDAWRCEWKKLDPRGRGSIDFEDLPQLLDGLGVDLSDDELEDAATRIQRWQASRLLLQGFLRWFAGDGGSAKILGDGDLRAARDGLRELNARHGARRRGTREIQRRFKVSVSRARVPEKASTLRDRSKR